MIAGHFPPSSSVIGVRFGAAASAILRPTAVDPVKIRWSNGSSAKALPSSGPAGDHSQQILIEIVGHQIAQKFGCVRRHFAGFDHHPVAGGQRMNGRQEVQSRMGSSTVRCYRSHPKAGARSCFWRAESAGLCPRGACRIQRRRWRRACLAPEITRNRSAQRGFAHRPVAEIPANGIADVVLVLFRQRQQLCRYCRDPFLDKTGKGWANDAAF